MKSWAIGLIGLVLMFSSCSQVPEKEPLVISVDPWVGSTPFYYAHARGWLEEINIQLILAPSIGENLRIYKSGASDMFTATQHEYFVERKKYLHLIPIIHYDRSFGGDMVMSNKTNDELKNSSDVIHLYIEPDTVNEEMANYWITDHNISKKRLRIHSRVQDEIVKMKSDPKIQMVLVTYNPHNFVLEKQGFHEIESTKNDNYLVIDAVYVSASFYGKNKETLNKLSQTVKRAMRVYDTDPQEFYEKVKPYFGNPTYQEFVAMKRNVQWFQTPPPPKLTQRMNAIGFPTKDLIL